MTTGQLMFSRASSPGGPPTNTSYSTPGPRSSTPHAPRGSRTFDTPWFEYKDLEGLEASGRRARGIVEVMEKAFAEGRNVTTLGNEMVEALHLAEAQRVLARAKP